MSFLTDAFKKANGTLLNTLALGGIVPYTFLFNGVAQADSVIGGFGEFYGAFIEAVPGAAEGAGFFLSEVFSFAADTVAPGLGVALSALTNSL